MTKTGATVTQQKFDATATESLWHLTSDTSS